MFLAIEPIPGREQSFRVSYHSPVAVVHPRMVSYAGSIEVFWSGVSPAYLRGLDRDLQKEPLTLAATSPEEEYDKGAGDQLFRQLGIDPEEFEKAMEKIATSIDPDSLRSAIAEFEELAKKYG